MAELISIIIPSYNSALWVCDAIESCLRQNHRFCEIIVIDDGSTDNTRELLQHKYGNKIKYIFQENKGLAGARNTGLRHATGDFIQFLDADDLIHPAKLEQQVKILSNVQGTALAYCNYVHCDLIDSSLHYPQFYRSPRLLSDNPLYELAGRWETELSIPVHCFLFKSDIFKKHGIFFDERIPNHEDWDCWMKVFALHPEVRFLDEVMAYYRIHGQSMCKNRKLMRQGFLQAIRNQKQIFADDPKMLEILREKKLQVCHEYRDVGPGEEIFGGVPRRFRNWARMFIPWRIRRLFY